MAPESNKRKFLSKNFFVTKWNENNCYLEENDQVEILKIIKTLTFSYLFFFHLTISLIPAAWESQVEIPINLIFHNEHD